VARRYLEVDVLKVAGILAVVLIHSLRDFWDSGHTSFEGWLGQMTRSGVPAFLAVSGFLYATEAPVGWATIRGRLRRIAIPYLVASLAAQLLRYAQGAELSVSGVLLDLLLCDSFGPYYYVFVILVLVAFTPLFARLPRAVMAALLVVMLAAQALVESGVMGWWLDLFWYIRNPMMWWAYFLTGWLLRLHYGAVTRWVRAQRRLLALASGALLLSCAVLLALEARGVAPHEVVQLTAWVGVWAILTLLFAATCDGAPGAPWLRWVSDSTYSIYLFHLFFLAPTRKLVPAAPGEVDALALLAPFAAGLAGSLLLVAVGQRLLGERSRTLLGA